MIYKFVSKIDNKDSLEIEKRNKDVLFCLKNGEEEAYSFTMDKETLREFIGCMLNIQSKYNKGGSNV